MTHPAGTSSGYFQFNGNQLWLKDQNASQPIGYYAAMSDSEHLTLTDGNGVSMQFQRLSSHLPPSSPKKGPVLKEKTGFQLFQGHVDTGIGLTEFILGHRVQESERNELHNRLLVDFEAEPEYVINQLTSIDQSLRQLATLTDPVKIGMARQQLFAALYLATFQIPEDQKPLIIQVLNRHIKVLAMDQANQLVLTDKDVTGMLSYLAFLSQCQGNPVQLTSDNKKTFTDDLVQSFASMPIEQKQILCCGSLIWKTIETNWNQMNTTQQMQFQQSMNQNLAAQPAHQPMQFPAQSANSGKSLIDMQAEFNARQNMYQMMSNMSLESHATSLNIIENIGGTGNYWEVTDKPYWMN